MSGLQMVPVVPELGWDRPQVAVLGSLVCVHVGGGVCIWCVCGCVVGGVCERVSSPGRGAHPEREPSPERARVMGGVWVN